MDIKRGFRIGSWAVSPLTGEIRSADQAVHLEPKVMEVLMVLAEKAESVVLRDELLASVWGARAATSDEPLTRCIAQLRQSLGDSSRNPSYIQTVPKRGYRLMVPALPLEDQREAVRPAASAKAGAPSAGRPAAALGPAQRVAWLGAIAVAGLAAYVALPILFGPNESGQLDPCYVEEVEQPLRSIHPDALEACTDGVKEMGERTADSLRFAMNYFRRAMDVEPEYGSAIINLARAMVLLPTYEEFPDPADCAYDRKLSDQSDCYDAAIKLVDLHIGDVAYIGDYVYGIKGYVYTQQLRWRLASGQFARAVEMTGNDADMWQWYSQFLAAVGDLDGALEAIARAYELNPRSGVILDRYAILLMWHERHDEAGRRFDEAAQYPHVPFEAGRLIWSIHQGRWDEVGELLAGHAGGADDAWIDELVAGLRDPALRPRAAAAVERASLSGSLSGQYVYGAWVLLGETERAIEAALDLIDERPGSMSVEFLFAPETRLLRQHPRFAEIVRELELDDYWAADPANCPQQFQMPGATNWCI
ncbi:MAG TPA: winged helix-turn-helix domain-containing protein [Gammaproteobacteria bacterium]